MTQQQPETPREALIRVLTQTINRIETGELIPVHMSRNVPLLEDRTPEQMTGEVLLTVACVLHHVPWQPPDNTENRPARRRKAKAAA